MKVAEWMVLGVLVVFSVYDLKYKKVFVPAVLIFGMAVLTYRFCCGAGVIELLAGFVPGAVLLLVAFCTKESVGTGDGLVLGVLGLFSGMQKTLAILGMALVFSAVTAMILLVMKRVGKKTELPFLPSLCAGYLLCMLW